MTDKEKKSYSGPFSAMATAMKDIRSKEGLIAPSPATERMDGKICLITGANAGLGRAIAAELAERGATLILACRSGIPETAEAITAETGNANITMEQVDLSDLASVDALVGRLAARNVRLDRLILNAGLMSQTAKQSAQGFETMLAVHFLANQRLATRLVETGIVPKNTGARIIAISSESHRSAPPLDMETFGTFTPHTMSGAMKQYGHSKLALSLMMQKLARNLSGEPGKPEIGVFHMCPGPVNSSIVREAPALMKLVVSGLMGALFPSPAKAAQPVIYLACSPELEGRTGEYMHLMRFKPPSEEAQNEAYADAVFAYGVAQFKSFEAG